MADTHFINVDLEIRAATDLTELAKALDPGAIALSCMPFDDGFLANFELATEPLDAESAILGFLDLIEPLSGEARRLWEGASRRDFSIGVQSGTTPSFEIAITPATLARVVAVGARVTFVVYAEPDSK